MQDAVSHQNDRHRKVDMHGVGLNGRELGVGRNWSRGFWIDWLGVLVVFFVYAGEMVPGVNEPHYWTKSAHFWDSDFCRNDLFLESGNAHWLFYATFGGLTKLASLPIAVWIARFAMWMGLACGWTWMMRSLLVGVHLLGSAGSRPVRSEELPWIATLTALVWLAGMHWGHWAGEWVVGGAESKVVAYAFVFGAFGFFFRKQWTWGWFLLGLAAAFHVVTGIWVILGSLLLSFFLDRGDLSASNEGSSFVDTGTAGANVGSRNRLFSRLVTWFRKHRMGIFWTAIGLLVGVLPAVWIDWGSPPEATAESAGKQVYGRLSHHLSPTAFASYRWQSFGILLLVGLLILRMLERSHEPMETATQSKNPGEQHPGGSMSAGNVGHRKASTQAGILGCMTTWPFGLQWLVANAWFAIGIALIGLLVDLFIGSWDRPLAAKILRFYWFRWNDVALPMAIAAGLAAFVYGGVVYHGNVYNGGQHSTGVSRRSLGGASLLRGMFLVVMVVSGVWLLATRYLEHTSAWIPFGDRARLISKLDTVDVQKKHYRDWVEVCDWVRKNTPKDGIWLTPRNQQSFKWRAQRAELAAWKDMPQD
ncbi:MAG: hypothetical protein FJ308_04110, partial [Planctomycetes bacterium]|nr:hypothetical protein [Planctomycetota bacterium]